MSRIRAWWVARRALRRATCEWCGDIKLGEHEECDDEVAMWWVAW